MSKHQRPRTRQCDALSVEQVQEIFLSREVARVESQRHGINADTVRKIRTRQMRTDATHHLASVPHPPGFVNSWQNTEVVQRLRSAQSAGATRRWQAFREYKEITGVSDRSVSHKAPSTTGDARADIVLREWSQLATRARRMVTNMNHLLAAKPEVFERTHQLEDLRNRIVSLEELVSKWENR